MGKEGDPWSVRAQMGLTWEVRRAKRGSSSLPPWGREQTKQENPHTLRAEAEGDRLREQGKPCNVAGLCERGHEEEPRSTSTVVTLHRMRAGRNPWVRSSLQRGPWAGDVNRVEEGMVGAAGEVHGGC